MAKIAGEEKGKERRMRGRERERERASGREDGSGREYAGGCGAAAIGLRQELECE